MSNKLQSKTLNARPRLPRLMRTLDGAPFPYEHDRFPVLGDVLERHGQHTIYAPLADLPYRGTIVEELMEKHLPELLLGAVHMESGAWTVYVLQNDGMPTKIQLGKIIIGNEVVSAFSPLELMDTMGNKITIYCNYEVFRCLDKEEIEFNWEAVSFSTRHIKAPLWTPEHIARSSSLQHWLL